MNSATAALKTPKITWWIIWGMMSFSIVIYAIILQTSGRGGEADAAGNGLDLKNILLPIAIVAVVISFSIRFLLTARQAKSSDDKIRVKAFSSYIISIALAESAAIYGLVLGLQGAPMSDCITFFVIGFGALILQPPTVLFPSREDDYRSKLRE